MSDDRRFAISVAVPSGQQVISAWGVTRDEAIELLQRAMSEEVDNPGGRDFAKTVSVTPFNAA